MPFWISWGDNQLRFGEGYIVDENQLVEVPDIIFDFTSFSVATADGVSGTWEFNITESERKCSFLNVNVILLVLVSARDIKLEWVRYDLAYFLNVSPLFTICRFGETN